MLKIRGLRKAFLDEAGRKRPVLMGVDLDVASGAVVGLSGGNGTGKSTLLRAIAGRIVPDDGVVSLGGDDLGKTPWEVRAKLIGVVEQDTYKAIASDLEVGDILALADARRRGLKLRRVSSEGAFQRLDGYDEEMARFLISRRESLSRELSGGQRQLLALAAACLGEPLLLLLDEHLASLDAVFLAMADRLLSAVVQKGEVSVLVVAHDDEWLRANCSAVFKLEDGRVTLRRALSGPDQKP